jgi:hypothetical protein
MLNFWQRFYFNLFYFLMFIEFETWVTGQFLEAGWVVVEAYYKANLLKMEANIRTGKRTGNRKG